VYVSVISSCKSQWSIQGLNSTVDAIFYAHSFSDALLIVEPVYRQAEKEWKDFIEAFTDLLVEVDDQVPPLPPKVRGSRRLIPFSTMVTVVVRMLYTASIAM
jgi:hypothetical protein